MKGNSSMFTNNNIPETIRNHFADEEVRSDADEVDPMIVQAAMHGRWREVTPVVATWSHVRLLLDAGASLIAVAVKTESDCRVADFTAGELNREANRPLLPSAPRRS
jgi:hypothetical protein